MSKNHELRAIIVLCFLCTIFVSATSQTRRYINVLQTLPKLQPGQVEQIFIVTNGRNGPGAAGVDGVRTWRAPADLEELTVYGLGSGGSGGGGGGGHAHNTTGPVYRSGAGGGGGGAAKLMVFKVYGVKTNDIFQISIGRSGAAWRRPHTTPSCTPVQVERVVTAAAAGF